MKIIWSRRANADRNGHIAYIEKYNPRAALQVGDAIEAAVDQLARMPLSGRQGRVRESRELPVRHLPYFIIYRVHPDKIAIVRVIHGSKL